MGATWFISDPHFGHKNIINFVDNGGKRIRPFASVEEHDETIIANFNKLVQPKDRVYVMGDVAIGRAHIATVGRLNGRKILVKGNHDIFKLKDYVPYFEDIIACRVYPDHDLIVSHIPVHTGQLEHRFKWNLHGHLHINLVHKTEYHVRNQCDTSDLMEDCVVEEEHVLDGRYINVCLEHTDFKPVSFDDIQKRIGFKSKQYKHEGEAT
jgi:calcineurin-like phosphoesterase family protein